MEEKILMKGNEAMAEAVIRAGCRYYFGYPITPQNEISAYMSRRLCELNGTFIQAESELAAISMVFGAAAAGGVAMTSSSSPGISLKQEGISYIAGAEVPCIIANVMRGGPGLGNISASQADYFQATKGGGHGDYRLLVLAPAGVQEIVDMSYNSVEYSEEYRIPVMIMIDGLLGQMSEPVILPDLKKDTNPRRDWIIDGAANREKRIIKTLYLKPENSLEMHNVKLQKKYQKMKDNLQFFEEYKTENADIILVSFGVTARICRAVVDSIKDINIGLIRPITLYPFPEDVIRKYSDRKFMVVELNSGQMLEDVKLSLGRNNDIYFYGRMGGMIPTESEIEKEIRKVADNL